MLFTADAWPGLASGAITVTFRTWKRPQVKVGGRYRVAGTVLEVDELGQVRVADISEDDVRRAGAADRDALLARLKAPAGATVWRVHYHRVAEGEQVVRIATVPITEDEVDQVVTRLDRMDRAATSGPWTRATLRLIAEQPGVVSTKLAEQLGRDRPSFKTDVRKLKALGLTESLDVGYRLSPRGRSLLERLSPDR